jgi:hypothetical protein
LRFCASHRPYYICYLLSAIAIIAPLLYLLRCNMSWSYILYLISHHTTHITTPFGLSFFSSSEIIHIYIKPDWRPRFWSVSRQISPEGIARVPPTQLGPAPAAEPPRGRPGEFPAPRQNTEGRPGGSLLPRRNWEGLIVSWPNEWRL